MTDTSPEQTLDLFAAHLAAGDLPAALALYEPGAAFVPEPGSVAHGTAEVVAGLRGFFALRPALTHGARRVVSSGDIALVIHDWRLSGALPDGSPVQQEGRAIDVLRRQADGRWLLVVDNPWGDAVLAAAEPVG